jgi:hypothetical protein
MAPQPQEVLEGYNRALEEECEGFRSVDPKDN